MKISKPFIALALALAGLTAASSVFAWHHRGPRVSIGFGFGFGFGYPYPHYYPPPYYYPPNYPAPVVLQRPPVYVEQSPQAAPSAPAPSAYWYYCSESNAYYPYVKECAVGWQRVAPQPG